jgi:transcriptional regulator with XRE-family HTH domain
MDRGDFSVFSARFIEACELRGMAPERVMRLVGLPPQRSLAVERNGLRELDALTLCEVSRVLNVSIDWLAGQSEDRDIEP